MQYETFITYWSYYTLLCEAQLECCGEGAPPDGCLQYYASSQGSFASFNFLPNGSSQYLVSFHALPHSLLILHHNNNQQYTADVNKTKTM